MRWRTAHNRRRAHQLKAGGIWTLHTIKTGPTWVDTGATVDQIKADIAAMMAVPITAMTPITRTLRERPL